MLAIECQYMTQQPDWNHDFSSFITRLKNDDKGLKTEVGRIRYTITRLS